MTHENKYCTICGNKTELLDNVIAGAEYTELCAKWRKGKDLYLVACGDDEAYYLAKYCPECGRKVIK